MLNNRKTESFGGTHNNNYGKKIYFHKYIIILFECNTLSSTPFWEIICISCNIFKGYKNSIDLSPSFQNEYSNKNCINSVD